MTPPSFREEILSSFSKKFFILILVVMAVLTVAGVFTFPKLETKYSLQQFMPSQSPLLIADQKVRETFQISKDQPLIATLKLNSPQENWLEADKIAALRKTTLDLALKVPGLRSTLSLATVEGTVVSQQGLGIGPLLGSIPPNQWAHQILQNALVTPVLISKDGKIASIIMYMKDIPLSEVQRVKDQSAFFIQDELPFAKVELGGSPVVQSDVTRLLNQEVRNFVSLGFVACLIVLLLVFANLAPVLISLIITVVSNVIVLAVLALCGYPFTVLSTTIPIIVTITVMSLCIHSMLRLIEEGEKQSPRRSHLTQVLVTMRVLLAPNFLASLTTTIGFLSLLTAPAPAIKDYGISVALSVFICWLVTTILLVPLLALMAKPVARKWAWARARWGLYLFKKSHIWAVAIVVLSVALAIKGQNLSWTAKLFDDLPSDHQVRLSTEMIDQQLGGTIPVDIEIRGGNDTWSEPVNLQRLDALLKKFRSQKGVGSAVGMTDLVMASNLTHGQLPASKQAAAEILFLYSLSDKNPLKNFLNADSSRTRIALRTLDLPANELNALVDQLKSEAQQTFPGFDVISSGMGSTVHNLNNALSKELIFGFWQSMFLIFVILIFVFRSARWALVACLPNLVPPAVLLGFLSLSETPIKPSIAIIFSIALGLAFNNTVYLLERLKTLLQNSPLQQIDIRKTLWLEGNPCLISSLTLLAGFSVFMVSYFAMNRIFGLYMVLSMLAGLVGDLVLLPTLLKSCPWLLNPRFSKKKEKILMTTSILVAALVIGITMSRPAEAAMSNNVLPSTKTVEQEMTSRLGSKDEELTLTMKIVESDGTSKDREMKLMRLSPSKQEHYFMARMEKPKDLKGTSLLATLKDGKEERWLYLPSSKQTRRLSATANDSGAILGSELNTEDFDINTEAATQSTLKKGPMTDGKSTYAIESNVAATSKIYSKIDTLISTDEYLPLKSECYDKDGKLLKVLLFSDYKKMPENKWRAGTIEIKNMQNNRSTEIKIAQAKLNSGLKPSAFTPKALADEF